MQKITSKSEIRKKKKALIFVSGIILLLLSISALDPLNENPSIVQDKNEFKAPPITSGVTHIWNSSISASTRDIKISQDGNYIVVGTENSKIYLFHKSSSTPMWSYNTSGTILSVDISSDGNYIVAGSEDGNLYLFNKSNSTPIRIYSIGDWVSGVAITPDGLYIAASSYNDYVYKFNKLSSTPMYSTNLGTDGMCVDISDDGRYVVTGTTNRIYSCYTVQGGLNSPWIGAVVDDIAMSSDGNYYVAGVRDDLVRFFETTNASEQWLYNTGGDVETVSISADGNYIVTNGGTPDRMFVFHQSSSSPLWNYTTGNTINSVAISDDGNRIVMGDAGNTVYLFSRSNSSPIWNFTPPSGSSIDGVDISSDGEYITFGGGNNQVFLYNHLSKFNLTSTITTPDNTSSWESETTHSINWSSTGSITNMLIELYLNGAFNTTISPSTLNDGSYSWTLPAGLVNSTLYQIKISDVSNSTIYDFSDYFEIYTQPTPISDLDSITVTNPSGIVAWEIGTIHSITWTSTGSIANVQIELYLSGILESVLTSGTLNDGDISWTIPSGLANSTQYQIKITDVSNSSTFDYSDYFAIYSPRIAEEIPGYDIYLLYMMLGVISVVLIKKKSKQLKK